MARRYAHLWVTIWDDEDFISLDPVAQVTYFSLISSRDLSWCGVAPALPKRIARNSRGVTERKVVAALADLAARGLIVMDDETDEILVRRFIHYDEVMRQPNVAKAMCRATNLVRSQRIRAAIVTELRREIEEQPDYKGWDSVRAAFPELFEEVTSKGYANPSPNPSENPSTIPLRKGA